MADHLPVILGKMGCAGKAASPRRLGYIDFPGLEQPPGILAAHLIEIADGRQPGIFGKYPAEVILGKARLTADILQRQLLVIMGVNIAHGPLHRVIRPVFPGMPRFAFPVSAHQMHKCLINQRHHRRFVKQSLLPAFPGDFLKQIEKMPVRLDHLLKAGIFRPQTPGQKQFRPGNDAKIAAGPLDGLKPMQHPPVNHRAFPLGGMKAAAIQP